jgi:hypothetical protein
VSIGKSPKNVAESPRMGNSCEKQRRPHSSRVKAGNLPRRQFLRLAAGAVALPALSRIARAQTYPT